jgi:hypothetical protein
MPELAARRHALNLPAGSIRAAHVLGVVGLVCAIILVPSREVVPIPPYLIYLLFLIVGHFFAAHGVTIATRNDPAPSPLYLPGGVVRVLVVLALAGTIGYKLYTDHQMAEAVEAPAGYHTLLQQYEASLDELKNQPYMPLVILGGFVFGVMLHALIMRESPPAWQDFEAWLSVLALVGLGAAAINHLFIQTTIAVPFGMPLWESILGGVVAFYFGARS